MITLRFDMRAPADGPAIAERYAAAIEMLVLSPLCGGVTPDVAWPYLEGALAATSAGASTSR